MKKILFISYDGMTDPLGQSQVIPYLVGLTHFGYSFTILSCDKPEKYKEHKIYVSGLLKGLPIEWVSIPYHKNPPVLSSVYDLWQLKKTVIELQHKHRFDMVHTRPGIPTLVALWMKKKYGTKFLNDIRGFWADERVDGGMWNLKNPLFKILYRYFKNKEDECIRQADYNTCLTYKAKEIIHGWKHLPQPVRIAVIPCSVDMELFDPATIDPVTRESFRKELGFINNDFIISYLGSAGGWYLTDEMLRFCALMLKQKPEAKFFFISNNRHADILAQASRHGIPADKILVRSGKRHEVPVLLSFSTYSIFFIKPCFSKLSSSPTKHGEIMAMGIPVITNSGVGDLAEIVEKYQAGYVLPDFSEASMLSIIQSICEHPHPVNSAAIRLGANAYYNLSDAVQSYAAVYRQVLG